jgi:nitrite reductase (NO-forming)
VRLWVLAAGPARGISFHVVGGVFDTVFKEGEYLLRPENETGGGAQALGLAAAQGGFVELVFEEPGTYTAVNHSFVELERGARALITVTA